MALVNAGKLFDVQKWIEVGKRHVPPKPYRHSPLRAAVRTGFHSMVEVSLRAGYDQEHTRDLFETLFWREHNFELMRLFLQYGAEPKWANACDVFSSNQRDLMVLFLDAGLDCVTDDPFAEALTKQTRPHLRIYFDYKEKIPDLTRQLNLALKYHAANGNLKWVSMLMWAGANPHVAMRDLGSEIDSPLLSSAFEDAIGRGRHDVVDKIGFHDARVNLSACILEACRCGEIAMLEKVLASGVDPNPESLFTTMDDLLSILCFGLGGFGIMSSARVETTLQAIFWFATRGGKLNQYDDALRRLRNAMYTLKGQDQRWVNLILLGFKKHSILSLERLKRFVGAPKFRKMFPQCRF